MKTSSYTAKIPNENGFVDYTPDENAVWQTLFARQIKIIKNRACNEYIEGIKALDLTEKTVPQLPEVNQQLEQYTGWNLYPVPALISFTRFFELLADKKFPVATFIRRREELDYLQEPDIFHEVFGHGPLLTVSDYAKFMHAFGQFALTVPEKNHPTLARLFWFTIEFGLINTASGVKCYGAGILSSKGETVYALEDKTVVRKPFNTLEALRTPYRIDIMQPLYYIIDNFSDLYAIMHEDLTAQITKAQQLGAHKPLFPPKTPETAC